MQTIEPADINFTPGNGGHQYTFPTHEYDFGGDYVITVNVSNQVTEGSFTHSHRVIEHVKDLSLAHIFTMDFTLADDCFPMEDGITFNATLDRGSHMNVTWEFGDGTIRVSSVSIYVVLRK